SEQLDYQPAQVRVLRHIRPKYSCPCCRQGVQIAPTPLTLFPKSLATPALLAHIVTAKFVDGLLLYRQEAQFARLGVTLGRATVAGWMIRLGGTHLVPLINLLNEQMLEHPLIHFDETRLQVLHSDKAPTADHWMWVRASGPPGRRIVLFDYDASRGGAVPKRLLQDYRGILLTDGWEPYATVAQELKLVHAGCMAHARRKFDEARKATPGDSSHAKSALDFIRELYLIEHTLWDREHPVTPARRLEVRSMRSAPIMTRFHAWLEALSSQVLPESRLGKAVHYTLGQWPKLTTFLSHGDVPIGNNRCENAIRPFPRPLLGWNRFDLGDVKCRRSKDGSPYSVCQLLPKILRVIPGFSPRSQTSSMELSNHIATNDRREAVRPPRVSKCSYRSHPAFVRRGPPCPGLMRPPCSSHA